MINTIYGEMDEFTLIKTEGVVNNSNEYTTWVEYRQKDSDEIIHRSCHVTLKDPLISASSIGQ